MKKTILAALVISTMLMGSTAVYAAPDNNKEQGKEPVMATICVATQANLTELTGAVQEISAEQMKVKAKDGEVYTVPLQMFSKQEAFKGLGIVAGTEVQLKRNEPKEITISGEDVIFKGIVTIGKAVENLVGISKADMENYTDCIVATACTEAVVNPAANLNTNVANQNDITGTVTVTVTKDGQTISDDQMMTLCTPATFTIDNVQKIFFADEITVNGKTVKVQN